MFAELPVQHLVDEGPASTTAAVEDRLVVGNFSHGLFDVVEQVSGLPSLILNGEHLPVEVLGADLVG